MTDAILGDDGERLDVEPKYKSVSRTQGWCRTSCLCLVSLFCMLGGSVRAKDFPLAQQFNYLMGNPKSTVDALVNFPWIADSPESLPGFTRQAPRQTIRIVSVETSLQNTSNWSHWESDDGIVWIDLLTFVHPAQASALLKLRQPVYAGYHWANQLLLYSETQDANREAVGTTLITPTGAVLNVGVKLLIPVHWDRPLSDSDREAFNAALERLQATLTELAHTFLDPTYVTFTPNVTPKPEGLSLVRMIGFARLWSYVKYNFVFMDQRPELNWDAVLDQYMPRIAAAKDDKEYGLLLQQAVALLKDGHTNVYPISADPTDSPPLILEPTEGKPVVTVVGNLPEAQQSSPRHGTA